MAKDIEFEWNHAGFRRILLSPGTKAVLQQAGNRIASRAGAGHRASVFKGGYGGGRYVGAVSTTTYEAAKKQAENGNLSKAIR